MIYVNKYFLFIMTVMDSMNHTTSATYLVLDRYYIPVWHPAVLGWLILR